MGRSGPSSRWSTEPKDVRSRFPSRNWLNSSLESSTINVSEVLSWRNYLPEHSFQLRDRRLVIEPSSGLPVPQNLRLVRPEVYSDRENTRCARLKGDFPNSLGERLQELSSQIRRSEEPLALGTVLNHDARKSYRIIHREYLGLSDA